MSYPPHPGIDFNSALRRLGGRTSMLQKLVNSFLDKYLEAAEKINELVQQKQLAEAQSLAHQIKGAGANLGINKVSENAGTIEQALQQGDSPDIALLASELDASLIELADYTQHAFLHQA